MKQNRLGLLSLLLLCTHFFPLHAQDENAEAGISLSAFVDAYYAYDVSQPTTEKRQPFLFNHNRHNEFNINLALIRMAIDKERYHAVVTLQGGTYPQDNYAAEENMLQNLYEAYAGVALDKEAKLWLDAGVFSSNLGFASALSIENYTLTRPLVAESSPYFLSGAKLTYTPSEQWLFMLLATNGWQRIKRVDGNSLISTGTQIQYMPNENTQLNWSTFIGTDDPDVSRRMRYFNNFYGTFSLSEQFDLIAGFDVGWQQESKGSSNYDSWYGPVIVAHMQWNEQWGSAFRAEYFHDEAEIAATTDMGIGFKTTGLSLNMDYQPVKPVMCRIEGRYFTSPNDMFNNGTELSSSNFFITGSIAVKIDKKW
jgi:hypothetical protein